MRDYENVVLDLRERASSYEQMFGEGKSSIVMKDAADAIEELAAVCRDIASFVIHYSDDDDVSAEVLCRKLNKIGLIEKDGAWWALPAPPKEVRDA